MLPITNCNGLAALRGAKSQTTFEIDDGLANIAAFITAVQTDRCLYYTDDAFINSLRALVGSNEPKRQLIAMLLIRYLLLPTRCKLTENFAKACSQILQGLVQCFHHNAEAACLAYETLIVALVKVYEKSDY